MHTVYSTQSDVNRTVPSTGIRVPEAEPIRNGSHYWRYHQSLHCCHPRNVCHACCYDDDDDRPWYITSDKGLFLKLCAYMGWVFCLPCVSIHFICVLLEELDDWTWCWFPFRNLKICYKIFIYLHMKKTNRDYNGMLHVRTVREMTWMIYRQHFRII